MIFSRKIRKLAKRSLLSTCFIGLLTNPISAQTASVEQLLNQLQSVKSTSAVSDKKQLLSLHEDAFTHLPALNRTNFLRGREDTLNWALFMTEEDARKGGEFVIDFRNSATVLPQASFIELYLNGKRVAKSEVNAASKPGSIRAVLTGDGPLKPGENLFSVRVQQKHRVDCSFNATNELWTEILPQNSGFKYFNPKRRITNITDLLTLPVASGQVERINFVMEDWSAKRATTYLQQIQKLVTRFDMDNPLISRFHTQPVTKVKEPGLDFFAGTAEELANNQNLQNFYKDTDFKSLLAESPKKPFLISSQYHQRHLLIYLTDRMSPSDFAKALGENNRPLKKPVIEVSEFEGSSITLSEAGLDRFERNGSVDYSIKLMFPTNFFPADYDSAALSLTGDVDLGDRKQIDLLVYVNGRAVTSVAITQNDIKNGALAKLSKELPLIGFKPGLNEIRLIANLNPLEGNACTKNLKNDATFTLDGSSKLSIPNLAYLRSTPDIKTALMAGNLTQRSGNTEELLIMLEDGDFKSLAVAGTLLAQIASQTGVSINVSHHNDMTASGMTDDQNHLIVTGDAQSKFLEANSLHTVSDATLERFWVNQDKPATERSIPNENSKPTHGRFSSLNHEAKTINNDQSNFVAKVIEVLRNSLDVIFSRPVFAQGKDLNAGTPFENSQFIISQNHKNNALTTLVLHSGFSSNANLSLSHLYQRDVYPTADDNGAVSFWHKTNIYADNPSLPTLTIDTIEKDRLTEWGYLKNLRLLIAGMLSNNPFLYGMNFIIALFLCALFYAGIMSSTSRRHGDEYERDV